MRRHGVVEFLARAPRTVVRIELPEGIELAKRSVARVLRCVVVAQIVEWVNLRILALAQLVVRAQHRKNGTLVEIVCSNCLLHVPVFCKRPVDTHVCLAAVGFRQLRDVADELRRHLAGDEAALERVVEWIELEVVVRQQYHQALEGRLDLVAVLELARDGHAVAA